MFRCWAFSPKRQSNMSYSGCHSSTHQWAHTLAFGGFSGKQSPVGQRSGPHSWSYYSSRCAALTFSSACAPLWTAKGMTGTGYKEKGKATCHRMTDDRSTMVHILEEPRMRRETERLRTFQNWPANAPVTSGELARAGFFFLGPGDKVQCFCCGGILRCWVHGDSPAAEHRRHFPTCSFILGQAVGNIPLQVGFSDSVDGQLLSQLQRMTMDDQGTAGQAVYPEMEAEDSRLTTFHNWPTEASIQPDVLARAGFFYTGAHCLPLKPDSICILSLYLLSSFFLFPGVYMSEMFRTDPVSARVTSLLWEGSWYNCPAESSCCGQNNLDKAGAAREVGLRSFRQYTGCEHNIMKPYTKLLTYEEHDCEANDVLFGKRWIYLSFNLQVMVCKEISLSKTHSVVLFNLVWSVSWFSLSSRCQCPFSNSGLVHTDRSRWQCQMLLLWRRAEKLGAGRWSLAGTCQVVSTVTPGYSIQIFVEHMIFLFYALAN